MARSAYVVVEDDSKDYLGQIRGVLGEHDIEPHEFQRKQGHFPVFDPRRFDALILLGGDGEYTTYDMEYDCLKAAMNNRRPVLAICQGFQVLATLHARNPKSLRKLRSPDHEDKGLSRLRFTEDARTDKVLAGLADSGAKSAQWHSYYAAPPSHAKCLAMSSNGLHCDAFSLNDITYGLQFHPEVPEAELPQWSGTSPISRDELKECAKHGKAVIQAWASLIERQVEVLNLTSAC